ncbi:hypothetical protein NM688_g5911 [Phlebia brevispora]|uniref:Uncharacterized protein n=1 Tax=Phlebia brevispora TaxID=194682 RepID=A0ACC1SN18_9APHY|nr:hypothetical protein NM688_g5911 [Phlebia brevispora]
MVRVTRSTTTQEKEKTIDQSQLSRKSSNRKRKRNSIADAAEQPAAKQSRVDADIKEEATADPEEPQQVQPTLPELPSSGDVPIQQEDAEKILDIFEMVDNHGLLDRAFPLPTGDGLRSDATAGPSTGTQSYSFRALLKTPSMYPIRVLRSAVQRLFPISSHPRSRPSAPATEQLKFCNLALSLLDQASFRPAPIPFGVESLISSGEEQNGTVDGEEAKPRPSHTRSPARHCKYALVQRLPTGDWWSSLAYPSLVADGKDLKDLPTAYADLVSIVPAPSTTAGEPPTLGSYIKKGPPKPRSDVTAPCQITCGNFLDYGPYASFAPAFIQDGVEIGRTRLGEVIWYEERERRKWKELQAKRRKAVLSSADQPTEEDEVMEVEAPGSKQKEKMKDVNVNALEGLLSSDQVSSLKSALDSLELENAVQELLDRNARALQRLEELQDARLRDNGGTEPVGVSSEEWDIAQGIYDSLTLLASLRPRSSQNEEAASLIPSASALRKLHCTLLTGKTEGWYGTLPPGRSTTLWDDTTIHIKSDATVRAPAHVPVVSTLQSFTIPKQFHAYPDEQL